MLKIILPKNPKKNPPQKILPKNFSKKFPQKTAPKKSSKNPSEKFPKNFKKNPNNFTKNLKAQKKSSNIDNKFGFSGPLMMKKNGNRIFPLRSGFGIGHGIGPKVSANLGFGIGPKPK